MFDVPLVLTPLNITVILLTQLGIPVKSIDVPEVDATAVPEVKTPTPLGVPEIIGEVKVLFVNTSVVALPTNVSVATGSVKTEPPATAGADNVTEPDVPPATTILLILLSPIIL